MKDDWEDEELLGEEDFPVDPEFGHDDASAIDDEFVPPADLSMEPGMPEAGPVPDEIAGPRHILVDARAVIDANDSLREQWKTDPSEAALRLAGLLSWTMGRETVLFTVVLDSSVKPRPEEADFPQITLRRASEGQLVSESLMEALQHMVAAEDAANVTVVTSDIEVIRFAAEHGIAANLADLFAVSLLGGLPPAEEDAFEKPEGLSEKESREWDEFVANWKAKRKG